MRKEFDAFILSEGFLHGDEWKWADDIKASDLYLLWQASRAALCVELPTEPTWGFTYQDDAWDGFTQAMCDIAIALDKAGVPHK